MQQIPPTTDPVLIIVRGLPGSGKSHLSAQLLQALGSEQAVMLDPDATEYESEAYLAHTAALTVEGVDLSLHPYRFLRAQAYQAIEQRKLIIWNQPFTNLEIFHKMIARLRDYAAEQATGLRVLVVEVHTDPILAKERTRQRIESGGHGPSDRTFQRFVGDFASFADEGYYVVRVNGADDVSVSVHTVMAALRDRMTA